MVEEGVGVVEPAQERVCDLRALQRREPARVEQLPCVLQHVGPEPAAQPALSGGAQAHHAEDELAWEGGGGVGAHDSARGRAHDSARAGDAARCGGGWGDIGEMKGRGSRVATRGAAAARGGRGATGARMRAAVPVRVTRHG